MAPKNNPKTAKTGIGYLLANSTILLTLSESDCKLIIYYQYYYYRYNFLSFFCKELYSELLLKDSMEMGFFYLLRSSIHDMKEGISWNAGIMLYIGL
jgi:hypothetical protein